MGLAKGAANILLKECIRRPFGGRVLTLGKQNVFFSHQTLQKVADQVGFELFDPGPVTLSNNSELAEAGYISDECFLKSLGFSEYASLDFSDFESAQYIFDLNKTNLPEELVEAFDTIIDSGTIEHVFHLPNALNNIFKMLKPNGRIMHLAPSSNYIDHGFYMFSPTLFWDFYEANRFEINTFQVVRHTQQPLTELWEASDYRPGCLDAVSFGGLDDGMYVILCIATKTKDSTGDAVPQQRFFVNMWSDAPTQVERILADGPSNVIQTENALADQQTSHQPSKYRLVRDRIKATPFLYKTLRIPVAMARSLKRLGALSPVRIARSLEQSRAASRARKRGLKLKVVARY